MKWRFKFIYVNNMLVNDDKYIKNKIYYLKNIMK